MRRCRICAADISHRRSDAETCGDSCRKELQRRRDNNAYVLCELDLEGLGFDRSKRKTSERRDERNQFDESGTHSDWDEIDAAWQQASAWRPSHLPADGGMPVLGEEIKVRGGPGRLATGRRAGLLREVDRLMAEVEPRPGKPDSPGRLPKVSLHGQGRRIAVEDTGSPGELWDPDNRNRAMEAERLAERNAAYAWQRADPAGSPKAEAPTRTPHRPPTGSGGALWSAPSRRRPQLGGYAVRDDGSAERISAPRPELPPLSAAAREMLRARIRRERKRIATRGPRADYAGVMEAKPHGRVSSRSGLRSSWRWGAA
jgi:hypothetical protein